MAQFCVCGETCLVVFWILIFAPLLPTAFCAWLIFGKWETFLRHAWVTSTATYTYCCYHSTAVPSSGGMAVFMVPMGNAEIMTTSREGEGGRAAASQPSGCGGATAHNTGCHNYRSRKNMKLTMSNTNGLRSLELSKIKLCS